MRMVSLRPESAEDVAAPGNYRFLSYLRRRAGVPSMTFRPEMEKGMSLVALGGVVLGGSPAFEY
ncbi:MAG: hypothetical protein LBG44_00410 [Gemmatimonadota bacterium]|nr:hypothetical protein [Gemmatimonadota bacterium]